MESKHALDSWARDYDELQGILEEIASESSASELHGTLSGMFCGQSRLTPDQWLNEFLQEAYAAQQSYQGGATADVLESDGEQAEQQVITEQNELSEQDQRTLKRLFELTSSDLESEQLAFNLILPDDEHYPIADRLKALVEWVSGYLVGVGFSGAVSGASTGQNPSGGGATQFTGDVKEALTDLVSITQVETEADDSEDNERYYYELVEYVKILVLTLKVSLKAPSVH